MQHFPLDTSEYSCEVLRCSKSEPHDVHMVKCMSKCCCLYSNSCCVYTCPISACAYISQAPIKMPVTLLEHRILPARFKNTMIELLKTSTDQQISKGVDPLKQLFLKKRRIRFPVAVPAFKYARVKSPLMTRVEQASC